MSHSSIDMPRVNGSRLWSRLMAMAEIGATEQGGCNRQALTRADFQGRELFARWAAAAGCVVRVDAIGNMFARRAGRDESLATVMTGSHLDTQPTGGKYDGVYGVLAGLEVIESLNDRSIETRHPLEIAVWCNEEGCRFPAAMMGSAVWSGRMSLAEAHALKDREGRSVREELEQAGVDLSTPLERCPVKAAFEVHIEQGPVLEQRAKRIGVVTGVQHMSRHEVVVIGQEAHAGPTPMDMRRDPVRVLADVLPACYAAAAKHRPDARLTVAVIETRPSSPNTVPGYLRFFLDLRHPDTAHYRSLREEVEGIVQTALECHGLPGHIRCAWQAQGVTFDAKCVAAVRAAASSLACEAIEMVSGAGHDSVNVASVAPTSMIFVPCAGGLSHNEAESASPADLETGANVLMHAMLSVANDGT
ncbi:MAG: Zn-dependent hydrolase [Steroidobacteraceae bacterium]|jgi:N-carbamoyl-L-amino-acid hydrolase